MSQKQREARRVAQALAQERKAQARAFMVDQPLSVDKETLEEREHTVKMIMLGYVEYDTQIKQLKLTEDGHRGIQQRLAQARGSNSAANISSIQGGQPTSR